MPASSNPLTHAPLASKTFTTTGSGTQDLELEITQGNQTIKLAPKWGIVTVAAGTLTLDYAARDGDGFTCFQGQILPGGCSTLDDANSTAATEFVMYY